MRSNKNRSRRLIPRSGIGAKGREVGLGRRAINVTTSARTWAAITSAGLCFLAGPVEAQPLTRVVVNGQPTAVFFSDGDSFGFRGGPFSGANTRMTGYNTLETFGPVHSWGDWHAKELYVNAKMATLNARRGEWTCTTDGDKDGYGRILVHCPGLAEDQIRKGYAHVMTVTDDPGNPIYVDAQNEAKAAKRGMWAHGIPDYVLTSIHSAEEDTSGRGTYNRLVSTLDGHSLKWKHEERYRECDDVCFMTYEISDAQIAEIVGRLKTNPTTSGIVDGWSDERITAVARNYGRYRRVTREVPKKFRPDMETALQAMAAAGRMGSDQGAPSTCMVHVPFRRRYGAGKAGCLR